MSDGREERKEQERSGGDGMRIRIAMISWIVIGRDGSGSAGFAGCGCGGEGGVGAADTRQVLAAAVAAAGGYGFYRWIDRSPGDQLIKRPLRKGLDFDAKVSRAVFGDRGLAPTYPVEKSVELRTNGNLVEGEDLVPESYRLQMVGVESPKRFSQYDDDVTAWEYRYAAAKAAGPEEHDTKVAPKAMMGGPPVADAPAVKMPPA